MSDENRMTPRVETSTVLFGEVVDAVDPKRQREIALGPVVYEFGGGRVLKREGNGPYES